jgi:Family of unknown function (DUF6069)
MANPHHATPAGPRARGHRRGPGRDGRLAYHRSATWHRHHRSHQARIPAAAAHHPAIVAATSLVAALAGWALLTMLERFTARAIWTAIAVLVALLSLAGPLSTRPALPSPMLWRWPSCTWPSPPCSSPSWQARHPLPLDQHQPVRYAPDEPQGKLLLNATHCYPRGFQRVTAYRRQRIDQKAMLSLAVA